MSNIENISVAIITVSDRASRKERSDLSGPQIRDWANRHGYTIVAESIIADDFDQIRSKLIEYSDAEINVIFTTGGTGFSPRDITPEATASVIERYAPGFAEAMRHASLKITPHAMLSRAICGIRKKSIIINLPGSPKAVKENLEVIEKALPHAVSLLKGEVRDCSNPDKPNSS
ncbi:MAG: MogA/MoaB family molybdenum cofactor biosynthesis protein [Spirochaetes bacterium]|nr:MogA/MoaB family molybdenum cofactor biosynthesis protein [Spirochaetota bacterium]